MRGRIVIDRIGSDVAPTVQDAENDETLVILPEIDPVLTKHAEPDAWRHLVAGHATMTKSGKTADMVENTACEVLGGDDVRCDDIIKYIVEITQGAWSDYERFRSNRARPFLITVSARALGSVTVTPSPRAISASACASSARSSRIRAS